jgi:hypothetical protein
MTRLKLLRMSDPAALAIISSTIFFVRLIIVTTWISGFAVVSAGAGDRWPGTRLPDTRGSSQPPASEFDPDAFLAQVQKDENQGRWPRSVCNEISFMESETEEFVQFDPAYRALMRAKLIPLLKYHCGVDTRAKERIDDAAIDAWVKKDDSNARRRAAVPRPPSWDETTPAPRKAAPVEKAEPTHGPMNCTIRNLGGDGQLSTMSCSSGPTNCIIRNLGGDGQISTMSCP